MATHFRLDLNWQSFEGVSIAHFADGKIEKYFLVVEEVPSDLKWAHN